MKYTETEAVLYAIDSLKKCIQVRTIKETEPSAMLSYLSGIMEGLGNKDMAELFWEIRNLMK